MYSGKGIFAVPYVVKKSTRVSKKWMVITPDGKKIHFGAAGYEDYTQHGNMARKQQYILRHQDKENWFKSGLDTAGFWARWLLWNKDTLEESARDIEHRFNVEVILSLPTSY
jgi:hypothetical protein